ncbi:hypothetical protein O7602_14715 [Micromonospora sp. WMMD1128]|uniref:hypothetical protein n=1 Tax=unclassified Micromonospora TaxID=2617518 RepID=UPI00248AC7CA|nr:MULTISPECIES: hypothetical protein [unclassified Micromonospora]WBB76707.1 hypothetical protein O7602_14715 [Micromonospora sp. WMMD1128]WFE35506.1 hypothetical protein O7613_09055 [Micromonospora sp. WMMD975]
MLGSRSVGSPRRLVAPPMPVAAAALALLVLAGCGDEPVDAAAPAASDSATFGRDRAALVLTAFDSADSAASVAGDVEALRTQEVSPSLDLSIAAVRRATYNKRPQPSFQHLNPAFAVPPGDPACFLATATLRLAGSELAPTDVSQFVLDADGQWKLSHNIQVTQPSLVVARSIDGRPATEGGEALDETSRRALAAEVFARSIGSTTSNRSLVASSPLLDGQFAGGWEVYGQQLAGAGATVRRTMDRAEWSDCAVEVPTGTLTFLTIHATDTLSPAPDGPATVKMVPQSPDLIATGHRAPVSGKSIRVARVETFLLLVPAQATGTSVLGLNDTALTVTAA